SGVASSAVNAEPTPAETQATPILPSRSVCRPNRHFFEASASIVNASIPCSRKKRALPLWHQRDQVRGIADRKRELAVLGMERSLPSVRTSETSPVKHRSLISPRRINSCVSSNAFTSPEPPLQRQRHVASRPICVFHHVGRRPYHRTERRAHRSDKA